MMINWARERSGKTSAQSLRLLVSLAKEPELIGDSRKLQEALLNFVADFSAWENAVDQAYLCTARSLVDISFRALGHPPGTRPLVLDPFAGEEHCPSKHCESGAMRFRLT